MSITVHLYYTGTGGSAQRFAREMEESGTADAVRREAGNLRYDYFISHGRPGNRAPDRRMEDRGFDRASRSTMMETITGTAGKI